MFQTALDWCWPHTINKGIVRFRIFIAYRIMELSNKNLRYLRGLCHDLKPVVIVGHNGITENVMTEIDSSISHHELIKIKIANSDRDERKEIANSICERTHAHKVNEIGQMLCIYRSDEKDPRLKLPE